MRPTIQYVKDKFDTFNNLLFDGVLPSIPVIITDSKSYYGVFAFKRKTNILGKSYCYDLQMRISRRFDLPENELEDIIIHEMIHYYIYHKNIKDTSKHGMVFVKMMDEINSKYGRNISISKTVNKEVANSDTRKRLHYVCVSELPDGRLGITVSAETRIFDIWTDLPKMFQLKKCKWYASFSPYFNRFPRALKPKIYIVEKDELLKNLNDAKELERVGKVIRPKKE